MAKRGIITRDLTKKEYYWLENDIKKAKKYLSSLELLMIAL